MSSEQPADGAAAAQPSRSERQLRPPPAMAILPRSIKGGAVTLAAQGIKLAIQLAAVALLARLLAPADFGLFAMIAVLLTVLELLKDMGLSTATVQRAEVTHREASTLFWLNVGLGAGVAALTAALAPVLARVYGEPEILRIAPCVAIAFLFTGLAAQHLALLRRRMRFGAAAIVQVAAEIVALSAALAAALDGLGVWALVIQRLTWAAALSLGAWIACGWRPGRPAPLREVRDLLAFGGRATAAMLIGRLAAIADKMLIGWYWGAPMLGLFERSQRLVQIPIENLNAPLANVALAALSRLTAEPRRYRDGYLAAVERLILAMAPLAGLVAAAPEHVVALVLGPQWADAAPMLAWMGVAAAYMPVTYTLSWLYMSQGRTREMVRAASANAGLVAVTLAVALPFGPVAIAASYALGGAAVRVPLLAWLAGRRGPVCTTEIIRMLTVGTGTAAAAAVAVLAATNLTGITRLPGPFAVAGLFGIAAGTAFAVHATFPRGRRVLLSVARLPWTVFVKRAPA
jgi:PST family polysaccharide transporter